jgi:PE family protein
VSFISLVPLTSFVTTHPEMFDGDSWRSQGIGAAVAAQNAVAVVPVGGVVPVAVDEDSTRTVAQFAAHAGRYPAIAAQGVAFHEMFVHTPAPALLPSRSPRPPT